MRQSPAIADGASCGPGSLSSPAQNRPPKGSYKPGATRGSWSGNEANMGSVPFRVKSIAPLWLPGQRRQRFPPYNRPHTKSGVLVVRDPRKVPAQLDGRSEFTARLVRLADRRGRRLVYTEHGRSMGDGTATDKRQPCRTRPRQGTCNPAGAIRSSWGASPGWRTESASPRWGSGIWHECQSGPTVCPSFNA
jgi:hypothetical protein